MRRKFWIELKNMCAWMDPLPPHRTTIEALELLPGDVVLSKEQVEKVILDVVEKASSRAYDDQGDSITVLSRFDLNLAIREALEILSGGSGE
jgi:hypothetical protein